MASHTARARRDPPRRARDCQRHRSAAWWRGRPGSGWGVGSGEWAGEWGQQGARARGQQQGPTPRGSRRPTINPSLRKIAPRRAAQPLNIRILRGGVGAGPHDRDRAPQAKIDPKWQKMTRIFRFFGVFWAYFFRQRHCRTIQRYGGLREGLRGSLVAWARGVKGLARGGQPAPRPPRVAGPDPRCR